MIANAQDQGQFSKIDTLTCFVYKIDIAKKEVFPDGTYAYSKPEHFQIAFNQRLAKEDLYEKLKRAMIKNQPNDSAFIECDFLDVDYLKHNDTINYNTLKSILENCPDFKISQNPAVSYYAAIDSMEFYYRIKCIQAKWYELQSNYQYLQMILGRTIRFFNPGSKECHLFILAKQFDSFYL